MEIKTAISIVLIVIILIIVAIVVVAPAITSGKGWKPQISFREACVFWSLKSPSYAGDSYTDPGTGQEISMLELCSETLGITVDPNDLKDGKLPLNNPLWNKCRNACKLIKGVGQ